MSDFAQPIYEQESADAALADQVTVDLNDPSLLEESLEYDASANPFEMPPPVPDQRWKVKLKQIEVKGADGQPTLFAIKQEMNYQSSPPQPVFLANGKPKLYITAGIEARIIDPTGKHDNVPLYDRFMDSRTARNGGVPMIHLLRCLGTNVPANVNLNTLRELFKKALSQEPECEVETAWVGNIDQETSELYKERGERLPKRVRGMHRFPTDPSTGKRLTEIEVEGKLGKVVETAQSTIVGYFPKTSK